MAQSDWLICVPLKVPLDCEVVSKDELLQASGICAWVCAPPLRAKPFWNFSATKVKPARKHLAWCSSACKLLECAARLAYKGVPSLISFEGCEASTFAEMPAWFGECGAHTAVELLPVGFVFHFEFVVQEAHS